MSKDVMTLCFHTRDAVARDDSTMTFDMPPLRFEASRVALASCEFPMNQMTIESDWSRLYYNEGIRLLPNARELQLVAKMPGQRDEPKTPTRVVLPARLNAVRRISRKATGRTVVECEAEHGLFCHDGTRVFTPAFEDGVRLLGDEHHFGLVLDATDVRYESPTTFSVRAGLLASASPSSTPRFLHVTTVPSPHRLCEWLTYAARGCLERTFGVQMAFQYDAKTDRVLLEAWPDLPDTVVRILPSSVLATRLGLSTAPQRLATNARHAWPSEPTHLWDYVEMPVGFYAPCHRSMGTGQPMRFGTELEASLNRFYFPLKEAPSGASSPHVLVFSDPDGRVYTCGIPCGRYTPAQLSAHLEGEMTRVVQPFAPGVSFTVSHNEDDRFVFACERQRKGGGAVAAGHSSSDRTTDDTDGVLQPAAFGLLFHHPLCVDPERFGFAAQPLNGSDTYVAPRRTRVARSTADGTERTASNLLRVNEMTAQKRFRVHCTPPPAMVGVIVSTKDAGVVTRPSSKTDSSCYLRTYVNGKAFAHGFQVGDVVRITRCASDTVTVQDHARGEQETLDRLDDTRGVEAVVVWATRADVVGLAWKAGGEDSLHKAVTLSCDAEPWNVCFTRDKVHSLPSHLMGFGERVVQWGVDGSVCDARGRKLPPFEAIHTHCLDHPDYVLITYSESAGASFDHTYDGESRQVWCKLSLYPNFREERMLPRDSSLARAGRFTIAFWNPDFRTPYHFHGAEFSFTLTIFGH